MSGPREKREYRRLQMRLPLNYRHPVQTEGKAAQSTTVNISTGGLYFETTDDQIQPGDVLAFEVAIPQEDNRFPMNGTITTEGRVVRRMVISEENGSQKPLTRYGIAAQFQKNFKLTF